MAFSYSGLSTLTLLKLETKLQLLQNERFQVFDTQRIEWRKVPWALTPPGALGFERRIPFALLMVGPYSL